MTWITHNRILSIVLLCMIVEIALYYVVIAPRPADDVVSFTPHYELVLGTYSGNEVHLADYKRKLLVMHSWASWCTYCAEELVNLAKLKDIYGDDIHILAVNRAEPEVDARAFTDALGIGDKVEVLTDPTDSYYKEIGGYAMPETVFIKADGDVLFHQHGPMKLQEVVDRINVLVGKE